MKQWQKIVGVIAFGVIGICELLLSLNAYMDLKYYIEPYDIHDIIDRMYLRVDSLTVVLYKLFYCSCSFYLPLAERGQAMRITSFRH